MRVCPFCGESVFRASIRCRSCGEQITHVPQRRDSKYPAWLPRAELALLMVSAVFLVLLVGELPASTLLRELPASGPMFFRAAPPPPRPPVLLAAVRVLPPPYELHLPGESPIELRPRSWVAIPLEVRDSRPCRLRGRIVGLRGGDRDFRIYVFDDDGFVNWRNQTRGGRHIFAGIRTSAQTLDVSFRGKGTYHLLVSNTFSILTSKLVQPEGLAVRCE